MKNNQEHKMISKYIGARFLVERQLYKKFQEKIRTKGYVNVSEFLRQIIREEVQENVEI